MTRRIDLSHFDDGIRDSVKMLWKGGFKTFTSCEGGYGHPFRHPTIGVKLAGDYFEFRDRLAAFLMAQGYHCFEISHMSCYHPSYKKVRNIVYLEGLDLLSPDKQKKLLTTIRRREQRLLRRLEELQ